MKNQSRRLGRSATAIFLGFLAVIVLSLGTDQGFHALKIYPPWDQPMYDTRLNFLALSYRIVYGILGGYITARLAPHSPMKHVWIFAAIGFVLSTAGAIAAIGGGLGPMWYPVALALTTFPCAWLGGALHRSRDPRRTEAGALRMTMARDREVVLTRGFHAPRELVFDALTKPDLIKQWYTPAGQPLAVCEVNLTPGGAYRFSSPGAGGKKAFGQQGIFREIEAPQRLVHTEWWDDWNPGDSIVTTVLTEQGGSTSFTCTVRFPSKQVRDTILKAGLEQSAVELYGRLAHLVEALYKSAPTYNNSIS